MCKDQEVQYGMIVIVLYLTAMCILTVAHLVTTMLNTRAGLFTGTLLNLLLTKAALTQIIRLASTEIISLALLKKFL